MKTILLASALLSFSLFPGAVGAASEAGDVAEIADVGNKICPVSGQKVGSMGEGVQVEYQGKRYNLCCEMCAKEFHNNPERFAAIVEAEAEGTDAERGYDIDDHEGHGHHNH